jgi:hypothetical protein
MIFKKSNYFPSFFSYLLVYPCSYPLLLILAFATESPTVFEQTSNLIFYIFSFFITIVGSVCLNQIFRRGSLKLKRNNKYTWWIFAAHIILIPLTYIVTFYLIVSTTRVN